MSAKERNKNKDYQTKIRVFMGIIDKYKLVIFGLRERTNENNIKYLSHNNFTSWFVPTLKIYFRSRITFRCNHRIMLTEIRNIYHLK